MDKTASETSIAVLSFTNLSHESDSAYFADGIRAQIAARLAKIPNLQVVSDSSIHRYGEDFENVAQIAAELNVTNLLRGTIWKEGDRFQISVQLIDALRNGRLGGAALDVVSDGRMVLQAPSFPTNRDTTLHAGKLGDAGLQRVDIPERLLRTPEIGIDADVLGDLRGGRELPLHLAGTLHLGRSGGG